MEGTTHKSIGGRKPIQTKLTNIQVVTSFLFSARSVDQNTGAEETVALDLIDRTEVPVLYMVKE